MSEFVDEFLVDALPDEFQDKVDERTEAVAKKRGVSLVEAVVETAARWNRGQTLNIAFRGGTEALRKEIADVAMEWTKFGNIKFNFKDLSTGKHREWNPSDTAFKHDIRIGFDQPGYWSLIGKDSCDPKITKPGQASMNFERFDEQRPADWKATVLHEFGHSLGFEHEHQHPAGTCESEFRWEDDPGYVLTADSHGQAVIDAAGRRPGVYTVLGNPPNRWAKAKVDRNLRGLKNSSAFQVSAFDKDSIMKYFFGAWMFRSGDKSPCFSKRNLVLSTADKAGLKRAYPT